MAATVAIVRGRRSASSVVTVARAALSITILVATGAMLAVRAIGRWTARIWGVVVRMRDLDRALIVAAASGVLLIALSPRARLALKDRNPIVFYAAMTVVIALLCCGPVLHVGDAVLIPS